MENRDIRIAFFDIDGTLLPPDHHLPEHNAPALAQIRQKQQADAEHHQQEILPVQPAAVQGAVKEDKGVGRRENGADHGKRLGKIRRPEENPGEVDQ